MRKKADLDDTIPAVIPKEMFSKEFRQSWARLIQKIYEVDPLICPKCQGPMGIISVIEELCASSHPAVLDKSDIRENPNYKTWARVVKGTCRAAAALNRYFQRCPEG